MSANKPTDTKIIIVAGGAGNRFGGNLPKQYCLLAGRPVVMHTIDRFRSLMPDADILLVISRQAADLWRDLCLQHNFESPSIVYGGESRWHSVRNALDSIPYSWQGTVLVHDAARPIVTPSTISALLSTISEGAQGAVPVINLVDSIRKIGPGSKSDAVDRSQFRAVQTPQAFPAAILKEAYSKGFSDNLTDDASVCEAAGFSDIRLVQGSPRALKITHPADMATVQFYIDHD
ncbi:MAG: 2-C-methyl-D-erythritol 4-phosphate cytidylyltransferase [Bacteroides sp.]|nr:2-C-methyl-D-erythritol 4-phosphate cytidylyltransferase [Bacteroides sp.]MCM1414160.1 2-C-methyl-D-erythritol 4-phosphate cytidylyltransferase [Bacteroides sp.]MCM1471290.1 2-C-methyl-D-erythritol 4-phosphate cytidylyltransferase [Bacteroides sp.]